MMFILKSKHDAAIAAKDAEIARLMKRVHTFSDLWNEVGTELAKSRLLAAGRANEIRRLEAKLARYTAPRERGEGGRFLPLKRVS
ncbi:hypothetical protein [Sphingomonas sp. NIC1]|uniref:hypothetical protein n=1 Tax=Sphingomonas sp. NIC1 TaxID=1961362 RepID=UPI0007C0EB8B|nr:hypothetical protein [Sphingomonas sp. NIC1]ANC85437.1 hypothetical protein A7E77_00115 [Sphingomonas sp. NIC1]